MEKLKPPKRINQKENLAVGVNPSLKAKKSFAVEQAQKASELFHCFVVGGV